MNCRPAALRLGNGTSSGSVASGSVALPMPAGLRTLGSAEDLQKEAEELKWLRKSKTGWAQVARNKGKALSDKVTELDDLLDKLKDKPPHMLLVSRCTTSASVRSLNPKPLFFPKP